MLAGPTASGKTTTAGALCEALARRGVRAAVVSLDDFYLGFGRAPLLENGEYDYESVEALNLPLLQDCLLRLMEQGACDLPIFDFVASKPKEQTRPVVLQPGDLVIFEGIHALNDVILGALPQEGITKLYVSVQTGLAEGDKVVVTPREVRLARRLVRDSFYRAAPAARTLQLWGGVIRGEELYLQPFAQSVDGTIDTFHPFEPAVFAPYLTELLKETPPQSPFYQTFVNLTEQYRAFSPFPAEWLPRHCLIREFIA